MGRVFIDIQAVRKFSHGNRAAMAVFKKVLWLVVVVVRCIAALFTE